MNDKEKARFAKLKQELADVKESRNKLFKENKMLKWEKLSLEGELSAAKEENDECHCELIEALADADELGEERDALREQIFAAKIAIFALREKIKGMHGKPAGKEKEMNHYLYR